MQISSEITRSTRRGFLRTTVLAFAGLFTASCGKNLGFIEPSPKPKKPPSPDTERPAASPEDQNQDPNEFLIDQERNIYCTFAEGFDEDQKKRLQKDMHQFYSILKELIGEPWEDNAAPNGLNNKFVIQICLLEEEENDKIAGSFEITKTGATIKVNRANNFKTLAHELAHLFTLQLDKLSQNHVIVEGLTETLEKILFEKMGFAEDTTLHNYLGQIFDPEPFFDQPSLTAQTYRANSALASLQYAAAAFAFSDAYKYNNNFFIDLKKYILTNNNLQAKDPFSLLTEFLISKYPAVYAKHPILRTPPEGGIHLCFIPKIYDNGTSAVLFSAHLVSVFYDANGNKVRQEESIPVGTEIMVHIKQTDSSGETVTNKKFAATIDEYGTVTLLSLNIPDSSNTRLKPEEKPFITEITVFLNEKKSTITLSLPEKINN